MSDHEHDTHDEFEREPVPERARLSLRSFLGQYAGEHTAGTDVPPAGVDVLGVGPSLHHEPSVGGRDDHGHRSVSQVLGPHPRSRHDLDDGAGDDFELAGRDHAGQRLVCNLLTA